MPAVLVLLGHRLEAVQLPGAARVARRWDRLAAGGSWVTRHPAPLAGARHRRAAGARGPRARPQDRTAGRHAAAQVRSARQDFEPVNATMGAGWATPYNIVVASKNRPITSASLLLSIDRFQTQIAHDPQVASVVGPGALVDGDQGPQEAAQEPERLQEAAQGRQARPRPAGHRSRPGRRRRHAAARRTRRCRQRRRSAAVGRVRCADRSRQAARGPRPGQRRRGEDHRRADLRPQRRHRAEEGRHPAPWQARASSPAGSGPAPRR